MRELWLGRCTPTRLRTGVRLVVGQAYKLDIPPLHLQVRRRCPGSRSLRRACAAAASRRCSSHRPLAHRPHPAPRRAPQVSACDPDVRRIVEAAGGSVTTVYYTRLGLRALLKPENFEKQGRQLPRGVRAIPPKWAHLFDTVGAVPPVREVPQRVEGGGGGGGGAAGALDVAALLQQPGEGGAQHKASA
jgi:hypothetical protein